MFCFFLLWSFETDFRVIEIRNLRQQEGESVVLQNEIKNRNVMLIDLFLEAKKSRVVTVALRVCVCVYVVFSK